MAEKKKAKKEPEFQRLPPQALELEGAVLGAMMLNEEAFGKAVELLDEGCFYKTANRYIFQAMNKLFSENQKIDILTVPEKLKEMGILEESGGAYYVSELADMVSSPAGVEHYSGMLREKAILRNLIAASTEVIDDSYRPETKAFELLDKAQERIFELSSRRDRRGFQHIEPIMQGTFEVIDQYQKRKGMVTGIATGFDKLDQITSGFQNSDFIVLAARPSMGKTSLALNIAAKVAGDQISVGFFSLEMNSQMIAYRLLCSEARIDSHKVRTGRLKDADWTKLSTLAGAISEIPLYIDDSSNLSVLELRARARRLAAEKSLGLVVVDYLQIMQPPPESESQQQAIASISRQLKGLAKELNVPVLVLSQLSRAVETRGGDKKPQLSDLRDSGAIEQDADLVMFIWRPVQYKMGDDEISEEDEHKAEVIIAKQRNGPTGKVELVFNSEYARFDNLDRVTYEEPIPREEILPEEDDSKEGDSPF
ncbi:MAG: replicative DNA helicase [FCB group bacterium]|nr:replicative DNA helicase [FCB group bacterium]